ncbi:ankyrin repeat domain-containing protein [Thalassotalea sp. PS06]|uniref:ankyrin repeat domain-containing protein n=1 Tax=Thalassotalea sp. PS06 TaxID=2594005 RepID=UPI0011639497|nr:ankyrin repeat domain-containing protein [Thalassotalea sp. PS06]QDP00278.1 hypothetical protein FNC98_02285 [Thalassotalea sp. PS06]
MNFIFKLDSRLITKTHACLAIALLSLSFISEGTSLKPEQINLVNPPLDSIQKTSWNGYPILIHRRTPAQLKLIQESFENTPDKRDRFTYYQSIARVRGNEFASAIRQFTEQYITENNVYMSENPEFGIYSMSSPILGCSVSKTDGGFMDPCNGVSFDYAGKVDNHSGYSNLRLMVPPHKIIDNRLVFIDDFEGVEIIDFTPDILAMNVPDITKALYAVDWERLDILKSIVESSPEVVTETNSHGSNLLHASAAHETTLEYLLSLNKINVNTINESGYSPLLLAVMIGNYRNAKTLLNHGATIESYSLGGRTAASLYEYLTVERNHSPARADKIIAELKK